MSTTRTNLHRVLWLSLLAAACLAAPASARALILDDIQVRDGGALAEVRIGFTLPMRYQTHFPKEYGEMVRISFHVIALDDPELIRRSETRKSPPNKLIPGFTVSYNYQNSCYAVRDPVCLTIQFDKPVSYKISQSEDDRSIYLYVPIIHPNPDTAPKPAPMTP